MFRPRGLVSQSPKQRPGTEWHIVEDLSRGDGLADGRDWRVVSLLRLIIENCRCVAKLCAAIESLLPRVLDTVSRNRY